jgi:hypothetical protein
MNVQIGGQAVHTMSDAALLAWMQQRKGGYKLRDSTARLWVGVFRALDEQGPPMTVRGLFYCVEMAGIVPKSEAGYGEVANQVLQMRRRGVLPYGFIADHTRWVRKPQTFTGLQAYFEHGRQAYRRAVWDEQQVYIECWAEKDAIAGILSDVTNEWDVPLLVCRGYSSETFVYSAAEAIKAQSKPALLYYFGDWDPSGVNISQGLERKLRSFGAEFQFERVAVTKLQIRDWNLPTRPPKPKDTRGRGWTDPCVEVDAIPANRLRELAETVIRRHIDPAAYAATMRAEEAERKSFDAFLNLGLARNCEAGAQ